MCGIAGISLAPTDTEANAQELATDLLYGIQSRGPDATGAAWYDEEKDAVQLTKIAVNATKFLHARKSILPKRTAVMILHTRFATTGDKSNRGNNHPIHYGSVVGVHNGVLWDHQGMFKEMGKEPQAQVDSEAIMALLDGAPNPEKVMKKIAGDAALAWIDLNDPEVLHLARVVDRPLFIAQTKGGSLLFASTRTAVENAAKRANLEIVFTKDVEEAKYLRVKNGVILDYLDIPGVQRRAGWADRYSWTSGGTTTSSYSGKNHNFRGSNSTYKPTAAKAIEPVKNREKVVAAAEKKADASDTAGHVWVKMLMGKRNAELLDMVKNNGSHYAEQELASRGIAKDGMVITVLTDEELVQMVKDHQHPWARIQLSLRGKDANGKPYKQSASFTPPTIGQLVNRANRGDQYAQDTLFARGYDVNGNPLVTAAPVE